VSDIDPVDPDAVNPESVGPDAIEGIPPVDGDVLPADLQPALAANEDYLFPNNNRRRVPGVIYIAIAAALIAVYFVNGDGVLVNGGILAGGMILAAFGAYSLIAGVNLDVDERDALVASSRAVGFPIGHASAQLGWRGLLSRPTWRILLYSADNPPSRRGLVLVDGVDGTVVESFTEENPEDWSEFDS
jgi:hypothetical protein